MLDFYRLLFDIVDGVASSRRFIKRISFGGNLSFSKIFFPSNNFLDSSHRNAIQCDINKRKNKRRMKYSMHVLVDTPGSSSHQLCFFNENERRRETGTFVNFVLGRFLFKPNDFLTIFFVGAVVPHF